MKNKFSKLGLLLILSIFANAYVTAETMYISDQLSTFLLKGPKNTYRIIGKISSGEEVTVLSRADKYALVKDSKGRQGWILSEELSNEPSKTELVNKLKKYVEALELKLSNINQEWENKTSNSGSVIKELEDKNQKFLEKNNELETEIKKLNNQNENLQLHVDKDKQSLVTKYFIYGGSVFGIGLIFGFILPIIAPRRNRDKWKY